LVIAGPLVSTILYRTGNQGPSNDQAPDDPAFKSISCDSLFDRLYIVKYIRAELLSIPRASYLGHFKGLSKRLSQETGNQGPSNDQAPDDPAFKSISCDSLFDRPLKCPISICGHWPHSLYCQIHTSRTPIYSKGQLPRTF
jgi:hypothetical protein